MAAGSGIPDAVDATDPTSPIMDFALVFFGAIATLQIRPAAIGEEAVTRDIASFRTFLRASPENVPMQEILVYAYDYDNHAYIGVSPRSDGNGYATIHNVPGIILVSGETERPLLRYATSRRLSSATSEVVWHQEPVTAGGDVTDIVLERLSRDGGTTELNVSVKDAAGDEINGALVMVRPLYDRNLLTAAAIALVVFPSVGNPDDQYYPVSFTVAAINTIAGFGASEIPFPRYPNSGTMAYGYALGDSPAALLVAPVTTRYGLYVTKDGYAPVAKEITRPFANPELTVMGALPPCGGPVTVSVRILRPAGEGSVPVFAYTMDSNNVITGLGQFPRGDKARLDLGIGKRNETIHITSPTINSAQISVNLDTIVNGSAGSPTQLTAIADPPPTLSGATVNITLSDQLDNSIITTAHVWVTSKATSQYGQFVYARRVEAGPSFQLTLRTGLVYRVWVAADNCLPTFKDITTNGTTVETIKVTRVRSGPRNGRLGDYMMPGIPDTGTYASLDQAALKTLAANTIGWSHHSVIWVMDPTVRAMMGPVSPDRFGNLYVACAESEEDLLVYMVNGRDVAGPARVARRTVS